MSTKIKLTAITGTDRARALTALGNKDFNTFALFADAALALDLAKLMGVPYAIADGQLLKDIKAFDWSTVTVDFIVPECDTFCPAV